MFLCAFAKVFLLWVSTLGEAKAPVPPTVEPGAKDFGGGTSDTPGHGAWMQEVGHSKPVEVLTGLPDWQTFYQDYVRANRPVVLKNAAQTQKAFSKWTDEYLLDLWRKRRVDVEIKKVEERGGPTVQWPFEKFLREMYKVERKDELYAVIGFEDDAQALADVALPQPARCQEVWPQSATLWMSNGGTMSVLHNDDGENFLMLLDGTKSVMLVHQDDAPNIYAHIAKVRGTSPVRQDFVDLVMFPRFGNITWLHGEIGPGDILFIPHTYWHQVNSKGRNLALNIWWSHEADWRWWDLNQYDATQFGTSKLPSFNEFKSKASKSVKCTPLPSHQTLAEGKLVDEGQTKEIIRKKRAKADSSQHRTHLQSRR
ncbi:Bifunctional peptidase and arginyl-hydroxylase JMJD5 (JmjC domain-containing protein 5) (Jumonji C domain-containing protein 5) (L-arginine (3R)-hydroxylase KDM8) (Lysine-specific demethylase 8) [Durusdinium trenchii]|uniref:Bifunctional peptidase and arginyl-hydroxylase JMJD5 (JmjC domain-containing protein 5) (Jumonji C domain-containing protein 5) (L-arginine (3R)-hydroxylase KDM8) (Lysine-specific demethylase 8) n=1 Tax=Durusdinium trenchii TaxID=1381693 RepID=A0ABP0KRR4_9DINO